MLNRLLIASSIVSLSAMLFSFALGAGSSAGVQVRFGADAPGIGDGDGIAASSDVFWSLAVNADGPSTGDLPLKDALEKVLRARRPEEFAFIERVIEMVDDGELPRSLVVSTFQWARKKPKHPFQYFERALRERAALLGIEI